MKLLIHTHVDAFIRARFEAVFLYGLWHLRRRLIVIVKVVTNIDVAVSCNKVKMHKIILLSQ